MGEMICYLHDDRFFSSSSSLRLSLPALKTVWKLAKENKFRWRNNKNLNRAETNELNEIVFLLRKAEIAHCFRFEFSKFYQVKN